MFYDFIVVIIKKITIIKIMLNDVVKKSDLVLEKDFNSKDLKQKGEILINKTKNQKVKSHKKRSGNNLLDKLELSNGVEKSLNKNKKDKKNNKKNSQNLYDNDFSNDLDVYLQEEDSDIDNILEKEDGDNELYGSDKSVRYLDTYNFFINNLSNRRKNVFSVEKENDLFKEMDVLNKQINYLLLSNKQLLPIIVNSFYEFRSMKKSIFVVFYDVEDDNKIAYSHVFIQDLKDVIKGEKDISTIDKNLKFENQFISHCLNKINYDYISSLVNTNIDSTADDKDDISCNISAKNNNGDNVNDNVDNVVNIVGLKEINSQQLLTLRKELKALNNKMIKIKNEIANRNLKLVIKIAKTYNTCHLQFIDIIQEGSLGLIKGIEKFQYEKEYKLSTYVSWWIRQAINEALTKKSRSIKLPSNIVNIICRIKKLRNENIDDDKICKQLNLNKNQMNKYLEIDEEAVSLEKLINNKNDGDDKDISLEHVLVSDSYYEPQYHFEKKEENKNVINLIDELNPREEYIILNRFGLKGHHEKTLEEIGIDLNLTRERVRQIEAEALGKLRNSPNFATYFS